MPPHPLIQLFLAHAGGKDISPHRPNPPIHLCNQTWKYNCECGVTWKHQGDAVWRENRWQSPKRQCLSCHAWVDGRHLIE